MQFAKPLDRGLEVRAEYSPSRQGFALYFIDRHWQDRGLDTVAVPLTFIPMDRRNELEPTALLTEEEAQYMMDRLWDEGLRPTGVPSSGELGAVKNHLSDMRRIAFNKLDLGEPK